MWNHREIKIEAEEQTDATVGDVPDYEIGGTKRRDKSKSVEVSKLVKH